MVQEIQAFQTSDDKIHTSRLEALKHEAYLSLERLNIVQHATIVQLIENAQEIAPILEAYAKEARTTAAEER